MEKGFNSITQFVLDVHVKIKCYIIGTQYITLPTLRD